MSAFVDASCVFRGGATRTTYLETEALNGRGDDLREARKGLDRVAQYLKGDAGSDSQGGLLQPLARFRSEGVGTGEALAVA